MISRAFCPNSYNYNNYNNYYEDLDKTRVKLFPNFTRHRLITQTNFPAFFSTIVLCGVLSEVQQYYRIYSLHVRSDETGRRNKSS